MARHPRMTHLISVLTLLCSCLIYPTGCDEMAGTEYRYADGSGNLYRIGGGRKKVAEYVPVKPEDSSSGFYDGGAPATRTVTDEQYRLIAAGFERAIAAAPSHIKDRVMRSGLVVIRNSRRERRAVLAPGSKEQADIESLLKRIIR